MTAEAIYIILSGNQHPVNLALNIGGYCNMGESPKSSGNITVLQLIRMSSDTSKKNIKKIITKERREKL